MTTGLNDATTILRSNLYSPSIKNTSRRSLNSAKSFISNDHNKIIIGNNFCTLFFFLEKQIKRIKQIENNKIA